MHPFHFQSDDLRVNVLSGLGGQRDEFQAGDLPVLSRNLDGNVLDFSLVVERHPERIAHVLRRVRHNRIDTGSTIAEIENLGQVLLATDF